MVKSIEILTESFRKLLEHPMLFVPKVFSTLFASLFIVFLLSSRSMLVEMSPVSLVLLMTSSLFCLSLLGIVSSMMLSAMVKSRDPSIMDSIGEVYGSRRNALSAVLIVIASGVSIFLVVSAGYLLYFLTGRILLLVLSGIVSILLILLFGYVSYFLPITLLEDTGALSAFSNSLNSSRRNSRIVIGLILFSMVLIGFATVSTGFLEKLGYAGFVAGRVVSAVINTYIFTVSPTYYIEKVDLQ